jgi:signal transduction histidine kinase
MIVVIIIKIILYVIFWGPSRSGDLKTRWFLAFLMTSSLYDVAYLLESYLIPWLHQHWSTPNLELYLIQIAALLYYLLQTILPYSLIMFSSAYSDIISSPALKRLAFVYVWPVLMMFVVSGFHHAFFIHYPLLFAWTAVYSLISCSLFALSYYKESHPRKRKNKRNSAILFIPGILMYLLSNYFARAFVPDFDGKLFIPYIVGFMFIIFVISLIGYGTLGIRFRLERQRIDQSMRSIATGTDMFNHALKNRINNINLQATLIKQHVEADSYISHKMELVLNESSHMMELIERIQHQINDIELKESETSLEQLINEVIEICRETIDDYHITVNSYISIEGWIWGDRIHLQEMLLNLLRNAMEAMKSKGGELTIQLEQRLKYIEIAFKDTGSGIAKEDLPRIFTPFFSTKRSDQNFGLGLTYSYQVAHKHGGTIKVQSELGIGTTLLVRIPVKRLLKAKVDTRMSFQVEVNEGK